MWKQQAKATPTLGSMLSRPPLSSTRIVPAFDAGEETGVQDRGYPHPARGLANSSSAMTSDIRHAMRARFLAIWTAGTSKNGSTRARGCLAVFFGQDTIFRRTFSLSPSVFRSDHQEMDRDRDARNNYLRGRLGPSPTQLVSSQAASLVLRLERVRVGGSRSLRLA